MNSHLIFGPILGMVLLTFIVWVQMFRVRVREIRAKRIHPQQLQDSRATASRLDDVTAADNFRNLFELPVLFYLLCLCILVTGLLSPALLFLCWLFVICRCLHSFIHLGYNKVMHRFQAYLAGGLSLLAGWLVFALLLVSQNGLG